MSEIRDVVPHRTPTSVERYSRRPRRALSVLLPLIAFVSLAVGFTISNIINGRVISRQEFQIQTSGSVLITEAELLKVAEDASHPIYWSGPLIGYSYLLTVDQSGSSILKYIPKSGTAASQLGAKREIATYIDRKAWEKSLIAANKDGLSNFKNADGSLVFYATDNASDVYLAFEGRDVQIEIYDSRAGQALSLALLDGEVRPIYISSKK